jgi:isopenicillin-N N-acyltransferase like protein
MPLPRRPIATVFVAAVFLAVALAAAARAEAPSRFTAGEAEGASLRFHGNVPIAVFTGTPEQIGHQHAALLGAPAREAVKFPQRFAGELGIEFLMPVMKSAGAALMQNAPERHRTELAALAERASLDAGDIAVANTLLELRRVGCSVLIVDPEHSVTGGPLFGRNFDFPTLGDLDQYSVVMVIRPEGRHKFASIGFPTLLGVFSGMNDAGLVVATLDVYQSADGSQKFNPAGTPLAMVFRRILEECTTVAEAEALLRTEKPTTWMNLAVCDRDDSAVFEITPAHISRRGPDDGVLACTNHFRTDGLAVDNHCWRYPQLRKAAGRGGLTIDAVRERLHAANQGELTLQTMVFEPRTLKLHLAIGTPPTSDDALTEIDLAPLLSDRAVPAATP